MAQDDWKQYHKEERTQERRGERKQERRPRDNGWAQYYYSQPRAANPFNPTHNTIGVNSYAELT